MKSFFNKEGTRSVLASLISIVIGLLVGSLLILIVGMTSSNLSLTSAWEGIRLVLFGIFSTGRDALGALTWGFNPQSIGNMLFRATPLILTGLSVAVAFKTGLFNIGAPGQYLMGTAVTLILALSIPSASVPPVIIWIIAFLGGILAGAAWGAIPGLVKAFLNINEVLACIMTNWIAANVVTWIFDGSDWRNMVENTKSGYIYKTSFNNVQTAKLGLDKLFPNSQVNGGIIIAILIAVLLYVFMTKTTLGYELKACGANRHSARYAGIADKRNIVLSMAIAGGLSGAAASLYYLSGNTEFFWSTYQSLPAAGFNGIPVALLAVNHPIGVIFTGIFMSMLDIVGLQLTNLTAYNEYITDVIIATIVYLSAFSLVIKMLLGGRKKHKAEAAQASAAAKTAAAETGADATAAGGGDTKEPPEKADKTPDGAKAEKGGEKA
ncbi:MAG: ABC transporter permease [Butyricicoccus sp.]|nr:ABC transporter permease [Butyricicoccus sp.]